MRHARVGGTEQVLDLLARHLAERGHEVTIVCRSHVEPPHPSVRFAVLRRPVPGAAWRMWAFARDVERHLSGARYDVTLALGKTWTHDVVRTGGGSHRTYLERARPHERRLWRWRTPKDLAALEIERRAFAPGRYKRVIANSQMVKADVLRRYAVPEDLVEVIPNGVDLVRFHPRNRPRGAELRHALGIAPRQPVLLFVGGGFGRKGLGRLLDALPLLLEARPQAVLLVLGRDSAQPRYQRQAAALGVAASVCFLGQRSDPEVVYAAADLCVLPTWYDSFAFAVVEALASGLPVVTTDLAGASELVVPGVHGAVLEGACGPRELSCALVEWTDPGRLAAAGSAARAQAERYGIERSLERIEALLCAVAGGALACARAQA